MKLNKALLVAVLVVSPVVAAGKGDAAKPAVVAPAATEVTFTAKCGAACSSALQSVKDFYTAGSRFQNFFNVASTVLVAYEVISRATASKDDVA